MASMSPVKESVEDAPGADATAGEAIDWFRKMSLIRRFEERAEEAYGKGKIGGFLHLYIGEEAIAVGAMAALLPEDDVITHYRDHGHVLARGTDPKRVMAELYGKATGLSKGKGGSMHMADVKRRLWGGYAIVGGHIPWPRAWPWPISTGIFRTSSPVSSERGRPTPDRSTRPSTWPRYGNSP